MTLIPELFKLSQASNDYKARRKQQMMLFFTSAGVTILASRFAYKSTKSRQFLPRFFQGNHSPPTSYNFTTDAAIAVGTGSLLAGSVSSMAVFGTCWIIDVSLFKEFGWKMKAMMGGNESMKKIAETPMDEESRVIQDGLNDFLEGKYDDMEEVEEKQA